MSRFIHTADWQIGKPFARVDDPDKRALLRRERVEVLKRIGRLAAEQKAEFVLVAGDLFDSTTPDKSTVSAACSAIGAIGLPVVAIPGNHDHAGPGSIWAQEFFLREQRALAPNLRVLLVAEPFEMGGTVLLPCPLTLRQQAEDPTTWLRDPSALSVLDANKPRIVLAHGSIQGFTSADADDEGAPAGNLLAIERLVMEQFDYVALGDWHGTKQVADKVWYSGTPEVDRFVKGGGHDPGNVLLVDLPTRGQAPRIQPFRTSGFNWLSEEFSLVGSESLPALQARLDQLLGGRAQSDLLELTISGYVGLQDGQVLKNLLESMRSRLLRLKLDSSVQFIPSDEEVRALTGRAGDPLIASVAGRLREMTGPGVGDQELAQRAFRELYAVVAAQPEARHAS